VFERLISIMIMMLTTAVFGYTLNKIGTIFEKMNQNDKELKKTLVEIDYYMKFRGISR
jgi:hypothetical protein